jgi:hypothetical protein
MTNLAVWPMPIGDTLYCTKAASVNAAFSILGKLIRQASLLPWPSGRRSLAEGCTRAIAARWRYGHRDHVGSAVTATMRRAKSALAAAKMTIQGVLGVNDDQEGSAAGGGLFRGDGADQQAQ